MKPKSSIDIVYLSVFGMSLLVAAYLHITQGYVLSVNYYAACLGWVIVSTGKLIRIQKRYYGVLILLILATFDIINFTFFTVNADVLHLDNGIAYNGVGLNLIFLVLLIAYCFLDKGAIADLKRTLITGSDEEQKQKIDKIVVFYYKQFESCTDEEFNKAIKMIDSYPVEAQMALKMILEDKEE